MTDQEIRIAVAEELGWRAEQNMGSAGGYVAIDPNGSGYDFCLGATKGDAIEANCPDYSHDLNACHEMEKAIGGEERIKYGVELAKFYKTHDWYLWWHLIHVTARQRCEAFLRVRGKWREDK